MTKRSPAGSYAATIKALEVAALPPLTPPKYVTLPPEAKPFFDAIVNALTRVEWTPVTLVTAVHLARCQAEIERESALLAKEGMVIGNARGTPRQNPRCNVLDVLMKRQQGLMRTLRMGGSAMSDARYVRGERASEAAARELREQLADEPLLA